MSKYTAITIGPIYDTMMLTSTPGGTWCASYVFSWIARELVHELVRGGNIRAWDDRDDNNNINLDGIDRIIAPLFRFDKDNDRIIAIGKLEKEEQLVIDSVAEIGVGLFFDHIIIENDHIEELKKAREAVYLKFAQMIAEAFTAADNADIQTESQKITDVYNWLTDYLRIYAVCKEVPQNEGVITSTGSVLSSIELEPHFPVQADNNFFLQLFETTDSEGRAKARNKTLRHFAPIIELEQHGGKWTLFGEEITKNNNEKEIEIKDIKSIATLGESNIKDWKPFWKSQQYYCVLNSDGDSFGKMFAAMNTPKEVVALSRKSVSFCANSAKMVYEYGGVPLYAGGDDLLAILPVTGHRTKVCEGEASDTMTVFELVSALNDEFNAVFEDERRKFEGKPTLSVGLSVQYCKSPLYEALECARNLLHDAKEGTPLKNGLYMEVQKHSGQSFRYYLDVISDEALFAPDSDGAKSASDNGAAPMIDDEQKDSSVLLAKLSKLSENARKKRTASISETQQKEEQQKINMFLTSAGFTLENFKALFVSAIYRYIGEDCKGEAIKDFFDNMFDNEGQKDFKELYLADLRDYCECVIKKTGKVIKKSIGEKFTDEQAKEIYLISTDPKLTEKKREEQISEKLCKYAGSDEDFGKLAEKLVSMGASIPKRCSDAVRVIRFMAELAGKEGDD